MIPPETLEMVRSRLDIVELVGECVPLTRAGRNLKARCPFHQERTPSFIVSPERQTFHCFGCGEGGDAFAFVMKTEGLSFMEAAEKLAKRAGVALEADRGLDPADKRKLRLKEALEFAADHYRQVLKKDASAEAARRYVASRKVSAAMAEEFRLGYAPGGSTLSAAAKRKGFEDDVLLAAGLAAKRPDGTLRDYFFDRLMFPIRDAKGSTVGFGGRTLGDGEPKYLNTPESPVFSKGRVLYGLYEGLSSVRKARRAHLMEGYMDVIAAHQHGLSTACAPLGTALTAEQAVLVKRYADFVVVVFDADAAGQNAAVRGAEVALAAGLGTRVASVPEGKDPDEFLHAKGLKAFEVVLESALDLPAFQTELLVRRAGSLTPEAKSAVAREVLATIQRCPDEILKDEWMKRLARRLDIAEDSLRRSSGRASATRPVRADPPRAESGGPLMRPVAAIPAPDRTLLELLAQAPAVLDEAAADDFVSPEGRELAERMRAAMPYDHGWGSRLLSMLEGGPWRAVAGAILHKNMAEDDYAPVAREALRRRRRELRGDKLKAGAAAGGSYEEQLKSLADLARLKGEH